MAEATHISGDAALAQVDLSDLSKQLRWDPDALARVVATSPRCAWWAARAGWRAARCRPASARPRMSLAEESGLLLAVRRWRNGAWTWPSWTRAPRRWRGPPPFCRRNWPPLAQAGRLIHVPLLRLLRIILVSLRYGLDELVLSSLNPAGHLPAARHAAGHSSAPATRTAVAPGAGVAGPHLRQVRPGAVHPPRPDSGRYRQ